MERYEVITSHVGKNLSYIISSLNVTNKAVAEKIGISYNTLSNIVNGRFLPSEETMEKIEQFVKRIGVDVLLLYKNEKPICNFRLRITACLSGNEKAALRHTVQKIERLLDIVYNFENEQFSPLGEYFDAYTLPYKSDKLFHPYLRQRQFQKIIQEKKRTPEQWARYFLKPADKEFWGNLYSGVFPGNLEAFHILYLIECMGIHLRFMPFGTEKVESCSTSLLEGCIPNAVWADSSIIINTDVCNTAEKCLFAMTKEFFTMISRYDEYGVLSTSDFHIESPQARAEAEQFAKELLLPRQKLESYCARQKLKTISAWDISRMKQSFAVGYELLIDRLHELNLCSLSKQEYLAELARYYEGIGNIPFLNSEPEPLSIFYRGGDFFECAILAAKKSTKHIDWTAEDLKNRMKENRLG